MSLLYLSWRRRISLLMLLITAAPLRPAPIDGAEAEDGALADWPMDSGANSFYFRDFLQNGSPLPNIEAEEMAPVFNFPPFPVFRRRWKQQYNKYKQQLQVQQTWLSRLQSPVNTGDAYVDPKFKRDPAKYQGQRYRPSISAGVMTNLGDFFNQLQANVHFAEQSQELGEGETQLLEGLHPHALAEPTADENNDYDTSQEARNSKVSKLLQSVRGYRPSQKIRSLVSRNPNGYRGSQFIDPSYMWLGLGK